MIILGVILLFAFFFFFSRHSACVMQGKIFIFGGWDTPVCFNDLFMLDLCKNSLNKNIIIFSIIIGSLSDNSFFL